MFNSLLALAWKPQYIMYIVIGVVLVLMIILTIVPQKKRQKEQQNMMNSLAVGTKIMTIGRMVGKITQINSDNTLIVNVGTEQYPTLIVIDKNAVGLVLDGSSQPAVTTEPVVEPAKDDKKEDEKDPLAFDEKEFALDDSASESLKETSESFDDIAPIETEKPKKKSKKK